MTKKNTTATKTTKTYTPRRPKHEGTMAVWLCTPFGILMPSLRPAGHIPAGDPRTLQVRTRRAEYLDAFRDRYCPELGASEHHPDHDYPWKAPVTPDALAVAVGRLIIQTDSEKFKPLAEGPKGLKDRKLARGLHACYNAMWSAQLRDLSDGTSVYDRKAPLLTGIEACRRWGHYWPAGSKGCTDCGEPNESYPQAGPGGVFPEVTDLRAK